MSKNKKPQRPEGAVPAKELLKRFNIAERTLGSWIAQGMPVKVHGRGGRPSYFDPLDVAAWRLERAQLEPKEGQGDLFGEMSGSVALEEFRRQRVRQAKRENDVAEGRLVEKDFVSEIVVDVFTLFRVEFETFERMHGRDLGDEVRQIVDRVEAAFMKKMEVKQAEAEKAAPPASEKGGDDVGGSMGN